VKDGELRFDPQREPRGWYFVEYSPPIAGNPFALVCLTILSDSDASDHARITGAMEQELKHWLERYPVPVMVSAFDAAGDLISLEPSAHLMGRPLESGGIEKAWGSLSGKPLPVLAPAELREIYHDIPFRTAEEIRSKAQQDLKRTKVGIRLSLALLIFWLVVIPVAIGLFGVENPTIATLVLLYSLWKAFVQLMKLLGKWPATRREQEESERKRRMEHYFWHCERNPEGFQRLMVENLDREVRERTAREARALTKL